MAANIFNNLNASVMQRILKAWVSIGVLWLLLGMLVLPTHKLYQQGLIIFLWVPSLICTYWVCHRENLLSGLWIALSIFALWTLTSIWWSTGAIEWGDAKRFLFVIMAWIAFTYLGLFPAYFHRLLAWAAVTAGWVNAIALMVFYTSGASLAERVQGLTVLTNPILSAQMALVFFILALTYREKLPANYRGWLSWVGVLGSALWVLMSYSRGPSIALVITLSMYLILHRPKYWKYAMMVMLIAIASIFVLLPNLWLERGLSHRPEIFAAAVDLISKHPWLGLGFNTPYHLLAPSLKTFYEHAHNLYLNMAVILGGIGLALWLWVQIQALRVALLNKSLTLLMLVMAAFICGLSDGVGPWIKPREEWFILWLPLFMAAAIQAKWQLKSRFAKIN